MRITIDQYALNGYRLKIGSHSDTCIDTSVNIDMSVLSFFEGKIPSYLIDLFYLSTVVYGIDRAVSRHIYSIDGWSRELNVTMKLQHSELFKANKDLIDRMLSFLTGDIWTIDYEHVDMPAMRVADLPEMDGDYGQVNLFSGGMDSFIGAIDYLAAPHQGKLCLISHYDHKMKGPLEDQNNALDALGTYAGDFYHLPSVAVFPITSNEKTCRSRSFVFIAIASLVASYKQIKIVVPENGSVSLNFPLSPSRRAACSTRTTHVLFVNQLKELLASLGSPTIIENPYEFETKGAMVRHCKNRDLLLVTVNKTNSCGKRNMRQHMTNTTASHCGRCMPCMYRRASLTGYRDLTTYGDTLGQLFQDRGERSDDFFAMINYLRTNMMDDDIRRELRIAGLGRLDTFEQYVQLVKDTRAELKAMIMAQDNCDEVKRYVGLI
ncbi:MAG: hypothetical protein IKG92_06105 [Bacteroidales bacterium]|nr:hypothetical protein [Bacteroidales bacterium]